MLIRETCPEVPPELDACTEPVEVKGLVEGFVANSFTSRCVSMVLLGKVFDADGDVSHSSDQLTPQLCGFEGKNTPALKKADLKAIKDVLPSQQVEGNA